MRDIIYLFSDRKKWYLFPWLIKARLNIPYSHVAMLVDGQVYQATAGGVHKTTLKHFLSINTVIKSCRCKMSDKAFRYMQAQIGKKYSVIGAIASTFWILRLLNFGDNNDKSFICSEYGYRVHSQDHKGHLENSDYVDPKDFEKILREEGNRIKLGLQRL